MDDIADLTARVEMLERLVIDCLVTIVGRESLLYSLERHGVKKSASSFQRIVHDVERSLITDALTQCHGNVVKASKQLGLARTTLMQRMKKHGIV